MFVHQTGEKDKAMVIEAYSGLGCRFQVQPFFSDMHLQYPKASLVVCRAGATTFAEVTAAGKGVIFIPFPFAADDHQVLNAQTLTKTGAAVMIREKDLNGKILAEKIEYFRSNPEALRAMASRAKKFGRPEAAGLIADDCYRLASAA